MDKKTIKFEIVTLERVVLKEKILQVSVPTTSGEITVLPGHIPLISILQAGVIEIKLTDGSLDIMSVSGGFIEVMKGKVVILADTAERAAEIDDQRVNEAYTRADELKKKLKDHQGREFFSLTARIDKELARHRAVKRWRRLKGIK